MAGSYGSCHDNVVYANGCFKGDHACSETVVCPTLVNLVLALETKLKISVEVEDVVCRDIKCEPCK